MLDRKFRHKHFFIDQEMTVKEFLDYVLKCGDFHIKVKYKSVSNNLFDNPEKIFYLVCDESKYTYKLNQDECNYLAEHNNYYKKKIT